MESAKSRFLRYVTYYTTSDEFTGTSPSTERQKDLGRALMQELEALKLEDVHMDDCGNVLATLPASEGVDAPVIALIAHMDTAPDASGENVKPRLVRYEGGELKLNDTVSLTEALCPGLESHVGEELIVTDGTTLLGADDKAGVAEIMAAVETMIEKNVKHGEVRVIFTTDEEIGNGVDGLDVQELGCDYGYTVDGGPLGEIEFENFNAASAVLTVHGVGVHPGSAKNVMINAATAAMAFHAMLPEDEVPEKTDGYEGFFHLTEMSGSVTEATLRYIIRDHDRERFEEKKALFADCAARINEIYGDGTAEALKKNIGSVYPGLDRGEMEIRGRNLRTGLPAVMTLTSDQMRAAMKPQIESILDTVCSALEATPPELSADLYDFGIILGYLPEKFFYVFF